MGDTNASSQRREVTLERLWDKLQAYGSGDWYPYHMPGHKRNGWGALPPELAKLDITEIDGFDNLHQPEDLIKRLQQQAAVICGAEESFYLVNGSSCGVLAAISAAVPQGGKLLMARNCHKSAYHAVYLRGLEAEYLYPNLLPDYDICDAITPEQVKEALLRDPSVSAVLIVSPTYEGRIADVQGIAQVVHSYGIPLIVDEAHGAHLNFAQYFAEYRLTNSNSAGADLVVQSTHKTLPALTQTALLHVNGRIIRRDRLRRFLQIYQTSSPSYPLMASIDNCLSYTAQYGREPFRLFEERFLKLLQELESLQKLRILRGDDRQDIGKLVISVRGTNCNGKQLYERLLQQYHLQPEMAAETYCLAMFTVGDRQEGYDRMRDALLETDRQLESCREFETKRENLPFVKASNGVIGLAKAWDSKVEWRYPEECQGCVSGGFVSLYPPGIPLLVPGEKIEEEHIKAINRWLTMGLSVTGIRREEEHCSLAVLV